METSYINLADFYRSQQQENQVKSVLDNGLKNIPNSANLHYTYGLHLVRVKALDKAVNYFEKSMSLDLYNPQYLYTYVLGLDGLGKSQKAITELKKLTPKHSDKSQLKELGLYLSQKLNSKRDYDWFMRI
jgi:tetratricopeptide (TPR) repeat protein